MNITSRNVDRWSSRVLRLIYSDATTIFHPLLKYCHVTSPCDTRYWEEATLISDVEIVAFRIQKSNFSSDLRHECSVAFVKYVSPPSSGSFSDASGSFRVLSIALSNVTSKSSVANVAASFLRCSDWSFVAVFVYFLDATREKTLRILGARIAGRNALAAFL